MRTLNPAVRDRLLRAGERVFAESGYRGAKMAAIAARAEVSTGNIYRYFANKDALFEAIFTEAFADRFLGLLRRRVESLVSADDLTALDPEARADADELLGFWLEHRLQVVTLLDRARGSPQEGFRARFVRALIAPTTDKLEAEAGRPLTPPEQIVLETIFSNTTRMLVAILETQERPEDVRSAFAAFWSYQLAGLAGLTEQVRR